jgi:hypothetical protein
MGRASLRLLHELRIFIIYSLTSRNTNTAEAEESTTREEVLGLACRDLPQNDGVCICPEYEREVCLEHSVV